MLPFLQEAQVFLHRAKECFVKTTNQTRQGQALSAPTEYYSIRLAELYCPWRYIRERNVVFLI